MTVWLQIVNDKIILYTQTYPSIASSSNLVKYIYMFVNRAVCVIEKSVYRNSVLFFCTCLERNKYEAALRKSVLIFITYIRFEQEQKFSTVDNALILHAFHVLRLTLMWWALAWFFVALNGQSNEIINLPLFSLKTGPLNNC